MLKGHYHNNHKHHLSVSDTVLGATYNLAVSSKSLRITEWMLTATLIRKDGTCAGGFL